MRPYTSPACAPDVELGGSGRRAAGRSLVLPAFAARARRHESQITNRGSIIANQGSAYYQPISARQ